MSVLIVLEQQGGEWNRMSWETLAAGVQIAAELSVSATAAVMGKGVEALAREAAAKGASKVYAADHELLADYTPDAYSAAVRELIAKVNPKYVLLPHTYQVRDWAPKLATSLDRVLVSDAVSHRVENGELVMVRQLFQGKLNADVRFTAGAPSLASVQAGAYRADALPQTSGEVETFVPTLDASSIRTKPLERFREAERAVDLTGAERIVSVGRGIKEAENIPIVQELAAALGAEIAASRPICDNGWLPMERQVGSSGQTVSPKLYVAVGISGAIQHLVGMKGSRTIVAINRDPNAPIFEIADYGVVGDLFQVVPALTAEIRKVRQ
jgi:electron transfer flavoprotein alpha subunit